MLMQHTNLFHQVLLVAIETTTKKSRKLHVDLSLLFFGFLQCFHLLLKLFLVLIDGLWNFRLHILFFTLGKSLM